MAEPTTIAPQQITRKGITPALAAANPAGDGSYVANDGHVFLQVQNTEASPMTVTIDTPGKVDGLDITNLTVDIPAQSDSVPGDKMIGPFPRNIYNNVDGNLLVTFSTETGVTIGAFRL